MTKLTIIINSFVIPQQVSVNPLVGEKKMLTFPRTCYSNNQAQQINHWLKCFHIILNNV